MRNRDYAEHLLVENLDDKVVRDKITPIFTQKGIKIEGIAKELEDKKAKEKGNLKNAINQYNNSKQRITIHEEIRKKKLTTIILPTMKQDLEIIKRKYSDLEDYERVKERYVKQLFQTSGEAKAPTTSQLHNI